MKQFRRDLVPVTVFDVKFFCECGGQLFRQSTGLYTVRRIPSGDAGVVYRCIRCSEDITIPMEQASETVSIPTAEVLKIQAKAKKEQECPKASEKPTAP